MEWSDFSGKKVALAGAGIENLSLIPHLMRAGATVTICEQWEKELPANLPASVRTIFGSDHLATLNDFDVVFRAPGLPLERVTSVINQENTKLTSVTDLFLAMKGRQTVGVTGTKGKGTTSTMIGGILQAAGRPVIVAGNIGRPVFDFINEINDETVVVMEVSSFQLEDVNHSPHIAVVLPITSDHLQPLSERSPNFHADLPSYIRAKQQLTAHQGADDYVVYSRDSQASEQVGTSAAAKKISVSAKGEADVSIRDGVLEISGETVDLAGKTKLRGDHLFHNAAVACAVAKLLGAGINAMTTGLANFNPLPHRMEEIGNFGGVAYIDDSYATAPEATIAALSAFKDRPIVLILGGSSKGADFSELARAVGQAKIKAVVLVGTEAARIGRSLKELAAHVLVLSGYSTFRDAVETAVRRANSGDVVLLSPAFASKDMFANAAARGEKFTEIIHELV